MIIAYAHFLLMLIFLYMNPKNSKFLNWIFYTALGYVVLLTELSNSPLTPTTVSGRNKLESFLGNGVDLVRKSLESDVIFALHSMFLGENNGIVMSYSYVHINKTKVSKFLPNRGVLLCIFRLKFVFLLYPKMKAWQSQC